MAKAKNPLDGLSEDAIRKLVEGAKLGTTEVDDTDDSDDSGFEIILRGKDSEKVLESLGIIRNKEYKPEEISDDEEEEPSEPPKKSQGASLAEKLFGAKS